MSAVRVSEAAGEEHPTGPGGVGDGGLRARFFTNTLVQLATPAIRILLGVLLIAILSRYLGVRGFGEYAVVLAYVSAFTGILGDWGVNLVCLREISRYPERRGTLVLSAAALQALIALGTYGVMMGALLLVRYPLLVKQAIALYGLGVLLTPLDMFALPFKADLKLARLFVPALTAAFVNFGLMLLVVVLNGNVVALAGAALCSVLVQSTWNTVLALRMVPLGGRPSVAIWAPYLREAWPLGVATVFDSVLKQGPVFALSLVGFEAVGIYNAASRVPQQLLLVPLAIASSSFPLLSSSWNTDRDRFRRLLSSLTAAQLFLAVPMVIVGFALAGPFTHILFGAGFAEAVVPFQFLLANAGQLFLGVLLGESLIAAGFQRVNLAILAGSCPVLLALLYVLVPHGGATGAAAAVSITYAVIVSCTCAAVWWCLGAESAVRRAAAAAVGFGCGATLALTAPLGSVSSAALGAALAVGIMLVADPSSVRGFWALRLLSRPA